MFPSDPAVEVCSAAGSFLRTDESQLSSSSKAQSHKKTATQFVIRRVCWDGTRTAHTLGWYSYRTHCGVVLPCSDVARSSSTAMLRELALTTTTLSSIIRQTSRQSRIGGDPVTSMVSVDNS